MDCETFMTIARQIVADYANRRRGATDRHTVVSEDDVCVIQYSKAAQNYTACLVTSEPDDGVYYRATYDGDNDELQLAVYTQTDIACCLHPWEVYG